MKLALDQAKINLGNTKDNPAVGCIIVKNDHVISSGYTSITGRLTRIVAQRGETTLCTYEVGSENNRSAPIATVEVEERGITLLAHGFLPGQTFVDYYNEPFDSELFDEYHMYVEDYCAQVQINLGCKIYTLPTNWIWVHDLDENLVDITIIKKWFIHHSNTFSMKGAKWGNWMKYKKKLDEKWNRKIPTT